MEVSMFKESNVTILVSDMKRSVQFYTETLGLKLVRSYGGEWAEVEAPGIRIGLHPGKKPSKGEPSRDVSIGLRVEEMASAKKTLEGRGLRFKAAPPDRGALIEYFSDPDGTPLYLIELKWG
jgi:lactoylglutathione lyase